MKAIQTRYHGPTNTRPARISATDHDGNRIEVTCPLQLSGEAAHREAAIALCHRMNWAGTIVGGGLGGGFVFVFLEGSDPYTIISTTTQPHPRPMGVPAPPLGAPTTTTNSGQLTIE